jgi:energy-coupling factor transporter ATP-binding protein EcfA2
VRVCWFAFEGAPGPVAAASLPVGELTAVIGANDAGKTRFTQSLAAALNLSGTGAGSWSCVAFEVEDADRASLLKAGQRGDAKDAGSLSDPERRRFEQDPVGVIWEGLREPDDEAIADAWAVVHQALLDSCLFAFVRDERGERSLHWCLSRGRDTPSRLDAALSEFLTYRRSASEGEELNEDDEPTEPQHDAGIVLVAQLGAIEESQLPAPVFLPADDRAIAADATEVISELARQLDWYEVAEDLLDAIAAGSMQPQDIPMGPPTDAEGVYGRGVIWDELWQRGPIDEPSVAWLEQPTADTVRIRRGVQRACKVIGEVATRLAPPFIRDRYSLEVSVTPQEFFARGTPVRFHLTPNGSPPGQSMSFGVDDVADGYGVWVQLALLQGVDAVRQITRDLFHQADKFPLLSFQVADAATSAPTLSVLDLGMVQLPNGERATDLEQAHAALTPLAQSYLEKIRGFLEGSWPREDTPVRMQVPAPGQHATRAPLFVIDEPERHLHLRVQRELARWLRDIVRRQNTQAVVVTHAVAFHQQADRIIYVSGEGQTGTKARARPVAGHEITLFTPSASEIGLDRGELLTGISVFLFVEGVSDTYVLEALFREQLHRIGVAVIPLHGVRQLRQIIDATVLLRYSAAKVALLIDDLDEHGIRDILEDQQRRALARKSDKIEERELAKLLDDSIEQRRRPTVLGLPARDIFFLLDETAIRDTFRELAPFREPYPGHDILNELIAETGDHWKTICENRFGIPKHDVTWYVWVAERMRERGAIPAPLAEVVDRLDLLGSEIP